VHLKADQATELAVLDVLVHDHAHHGAVENLGNRVAVRDQMNLVPIGVLDQRFQLV
jgi:hypothetical protein